MDGKTEKKLINRLKRIQGQVAGLGKMVKANKYCVDIITQSLAAQKSLESFNRCMLENHLKEHVSQQFRKGNDDKVVNELLTIYYLNRR